MATAPRSALASPWLTAVLALAAAVLAALLVLEVRDGRSASGPGVTTASPAVDEEARARLQLIAARAGEGVLTYRHRSFDRDLARVSARLEPDFAAQYAAAMERVRRDALRDGIDQRAVAVAAGVVSASGTRAQVLVFVNQETTSAATRARRSRRDRLVVDLVRRDEGWRVAGVTALG